MSAIQHEVYLRVFSNIYPRCTECLSVYSCYLVLGLFIYKLVSAKKLIYARTRSI